MCLRPVSLRPTPNVPFVRDGAFVTAGTIVLTLDNPDLTYQLDATKLEVARLENELNYSRQRGASASDIGRLVANIEGARAYVQRLRDNVAKLQIRAPIDGVVQRLTPDPLGDYVGSYFDVQTPLMNIVTPGAYEAVAAVSHRDYGRIAADQAADIRLWSLDDRVFHSTVASKSPEPVRQMSSAAFFRCPRR